MTVGRYLLGCALLVCALAPVVLGARSLRRGLLPRWSGPPAGVVDSVVGLALLVAVIELLGLVGAFRLVPTLLAMAAGGLLLGAASRRVRPAGAGAAPPAPPDAGGPSTRLAALAAVALLAAAWGARVAASVGNGMSGADSLWYHLPQAARFVQEGSITGLHFFDGEPLTAFYPSTASLFHAVGMMAFDRDLLSLLLNPAWLCLALLAGWAIGRPWGVGPASVVAVCVVVGLPIMVTTQAGTAYSDVAGLALFLAALALVVNARGERAPIVLAGLAAGLALGVKLTFALPVAALTVAAVALVPRGRRRSTAAVWAALLVAAGSCWYLRNLIATGSPFPPADLRMGPISLPHVEVTTPASSLVEYVTDGRLWRELFFPGLLQAFGPVWWALLALAGGGAVAAVLRADERAVRLVGCLGIACALAFVLQPQALGVTGIPFFFTVNLRYAAVAVIVGLLALALVPDLRARRRPWWVLGALGAVLLATQLDPAVWPTGLRARPFDQPPSDGESLTGLAFGVLVIVAGLVHLGGRRRLAASGGRGAVALAAVAAVAAGWGLQHVYLRDRYEKANPLPVTFRWAQDVHDARIGIVGFFVQYPSTGATSPTMSSTWGATAATGRSSRRPPAPGGSGRSTAGATTTW